MLGLLSLPFLGAWGGSGPRSTRRVIPGPGHAAHPTGLECVVDRGSARPSRGDRIRARVPDLRPVVRLGVLPGRCVPHSSRPGCAPDAIRALERGPQQRYRKLALPPGLRFDEIADRIGALPGLDADTVRALAANGVVRSRFEPAGVDSLEGLTWPDTYLVEENEDEDRGAADDRLDLRTAGRGRSDSTSRATPTGP